METKKCTILSNRLDKTVLILPMRNGNRSGISIPVVSVKFLSYLWGMETKSSRTAAQITYAFLSYLWGMETDTLGEFFSGISMFLSYLWGMETFCYAGYQLTYPVLILPMRNGNSYKSNKTFSVNLLSFLSYLWGMETK